MLWSANCFEGSGGYRIFPYYPLQATGVSPQGSVANTYDGNSPDQQKWCYKGKDEKKVSVHLQ